MDDLAQICLNLLEIDNPPHWVNVGTNQEVSILELAYLIAEVVGFKGTIKTGDPALDGTPRKKVDCSLLHSLMSFEETTLSEGLKISYDDFLRKQTNA